MKAVADREQLEGDATPRIRPSSTVRHVLLAALICASGGCHSLRNQLKALSGSDSTAAASTATARSGGSPAAMPRAYGSSAHPAILDQTLRIRHDPSERDAGQGPTVPRFAWTGHGGRLGGPYGVGGGSRRQRGS